ncbi:MAG: hypothetical protein JXA41_15705 [Deltaproteobacteria bacterium]|nr:hypothetical protein [Deltaproteobacteria bacterium]
MFVFFDIADVLLRHIAKQMTGGGDEKRPCNTPQGVERYESGRGDADSPDQERGHSAQPIDESKAKDRSHLMRFQQGQNFCGLHLP